MNSNKQKKQYHSGFILIFGFSVVVFIMVALTIIWIVHVSESKTNIHTIFTEQKQSRLLMSLRDAARQRAIFLHRMALMEDEFDRDDEYMKFKEAAGEFIKARDELLSLEQEAAEEIAIWNKAKPNIQKGQQVQQEVLELLLTGETTKANQLLLDKVIPIQNNVNMVLSAMFKLQDQIAETAYQEASRRNENIHWFASVAGGSAILFTVCIAIVVTRRTLSAEAGLSEARKAAQTATELKSQFLANMSHEIRTPLTAVIGYADTLLEHDLPEDEREHSVTRILHNGKHLLRIINDILDISKIEAGQLAVEKISVSPIELMRDIDSLIGKSIRDKGLAFNISYQYPLPCELMTDPTRLKQILLNLISNAKKFTAQGAINIDVAFSHTNSVMQYVIQDSGVGMSEEERLHLFKPFSQADASTTRKYGGTGLGLYISQQLAKLLGGELVCTSKKGKGSCFTVTIASGVTAESQFIEAPETWAPKTLDELPCEVPSLKGNVLLAEDIVDNQRLISMYIKCTGATVVVVNNGQQAVEHALANTFDLILMDLQMPVMSGCEALQWLRRVGNQTPVVMLTANAMNEEQEHCRELGANDYLTKPINKQAFYKVLDKHLRLNQSPEVFIEEFDDDMRELVEAFVVALPSRVSELEQALGAQNWGQVKAIVHQLKGLGGGFGFPEITEQCADVEAKIRNGNLELAAANLASLFDYSAQIVKVHSEADADERKLGA